MLNNKFFTSIKLFELHSHDFRHTFVCINARKKNLFTKWMGNRTEKGLVKWAWKWKQEYEHKLYYASTLKVSVCELGSMQKWSEFEVVFVWYREKLCMCVCEREKMHVRVCCVWERKCVCVCWVCINVIEKEREIQIVRVGKYWAKEWNVTSLGEKECVHAPPHKRTHSLRQDISLSHTHSHYNTHSLSHTHILSLSHTQTQTHTHIKHILSHTHTHSLSLSLSLSHAHTHWSTIRA